MLYLSIGENCLVGKMLNRFGLSTWNTPYTWSKSNIFYAIECEEQNYANLLNHIVKDTQCAFPKLWRNKSFLSLQGSFETSVANGFEFSHHDVVNNSDDKKSYERKMQRMISLRETDEDIVFFYHHRYVEPDNMDIVIDGCEKFLQYYSKHKKRNVVILTQRLITDYSQRHIEMTQYGSCTVVLFYTTAVWDGDEKFSGEVDDDLFVEMFKGLMKYGIIDDLDFLEDYKYSPLYYLNDHDDAIEHRLRYLLNGKTDNLYIWGYYSVGYALADYMISRGFRINAFIDNDPTKQGKERNGLHVIPYSSNIHNPIIVSMKEKDCKNQSLNQVLNGNFISYETLFSNLDVDFKNIS